MADAVNVKAMPDNGSAERVAYDLYKYLRGGSDEQKKEHLDFFAECLEAASGARTVKK